MVEPGLSQRLRRHSRNSGMMIGVSMAAAMVICIAAFIWIYVQIGPLLSDFIPQDDISGDPQDETTGLIDGTDDATPEDDAEPDDEFVFDEIPPELAGTPLTTDEEVSGDDGEDEELTEDEEESNDDTAADQDTASQVDEEEWEPTHEIREGPNVNFRSGPNTISQAQGSLAPGTPMQFLDEEEPSGGVTWMYFSIEDGTEGWIRDIDVIAYEDEDAETDDE